MTVSSQTLKVTYDPLTELMAHYAGRKGERLENKPKAATVEERLKNRIVDGDKVGLTADLDEALKQYSAIDIINTILLAGMKVVGDLFGSGQMQLPFVLQSAEVMKAAVSYLEQFMDKASTTSRGTMVIATVKGDVHDIGKNLVDIILTNNGYKVFNLGIKCPIENMLHSAEDNRANAIGMSGLLVKSTLIMKENLEVMNERGITIPVVVGGAALTRRYVEEDLRRIYKGTVLYANDAFDGLRYMEGIVKGEMEPAATVVEMGDEEDVLTGAEAKIVMGKKYGGMGDKRPETGLGGDVVATKSPTKSNVNKDVPIPEPPFWGTRVVEEVSLDEVFKYVNEVALIRGQWQVRKGKIKEEEYRKLLEEKIYPEYSNLKSQIGDCFSLRLSMVIFRVSRTPMT